MLLQHYTDGSLCDFDSEKGVVDLNSIVKFDNAITPEEHSKNSRHVGYCTQRECGWIAIYARNDGLALQIKRQKWLLMNESVKVSYFFDFMIERIVFSVSDSIADFTIKYRKWWEEHPDFPVDPVYASESFVAENNDLLAYVDQLKRSDFAAQDMFNKWRKRL